MERFPRTKLVRRAPVFVVCDDREVIRRGLVEMLQAIDATAGVHSFGSVSGAWKQLADGPAPAATAVLGWMPAIEELRLLGRPVSPPTQVLLLLPNADPALLEVAAELPADGYLLERDLSVPTFAAALRGLVAGEYPMPAEMAEFLLVRMRSPEPAKAAPVSARDRAVLELVVAGATNKGIAEELGLSVHGVKHHIAHLLKQLNCANRTEAAARAIRQGLIAPPTISTPPEPTYDAR